MFVQSDGTVFGSNSQNKLEDEDDQEEHRAQGQIGYKTYLKYFVKGVGWFQSTFLAFVMVLGQVSFLRPGLTNYQKNEETASKYLGKSKLIQSSFGKWIAEPLNEYLI